MIFRPRIVLLAAALALAAGSARAQTDERLARMKHDLTLTDDQAKKVAAILAAQDAQEARDKTAAGTDATKLKALGTARKQKTDAQIDAVLTPEQRTKRQALRAERKKKRAAAPASPATAKPAQPGAAAKPSAPAASAKPGSPAPSAKPASPAPSAKPPATTLAPKPTPKPSRQS